MTTGPSTDQSRPERAFLDANAIRGQLTTNILLTLAAQDIFTPRWSSDVLAEMRRNRPPRVREDQIDRRISKMNEAFPHALITGYAPHVEAMPADPKDKHVLAAAVVGRCDVLVTENVKDFHPPASGPNAIRVESVSTFLSRKLEEQPDRVLRSLQVLVDRHRSPPQTMSELVEAMANVQELRDFAQALGNSVPATQSGTHRHLAVGQGHSARAVALGQVADPSGVANAPRHPIGARPSRSRAGRGDQQHTL